MAKLNPFDLFDVESLLSEEEIMIKESVARFVDERAMPLIASHFDKAEFPSELVPEIERCDSGLRSFVSVQSSLCMYPIHAYGTEEHKQRWLPGMAAGEIIGCFGLTESHGGSDPASMKTHARRKGDDWIINGSKMWITNGSIADIAVVWATTDEGIMGFVLEKGMPGFESRTIKSKMSLRASVTSELYFDNVRVPEGNRLPNVTGLKGPLGCLTQARYGISWGPIGCAIDCLAEVIGYTADRVLFGRPLAANQAIQIRLAEMARRITTAQLLALQLGRMKDAGQMQPTQVSIAKWNNVRMALDIARDCRDILGGSGITTEYKAIRHMLNLESVITYEGTETVHQLVVGRELTGINAF
jgi:glutaryl-CoA dehydrogenase